MRYQNAFVARLTRLEHFAARLGPHCKCKKELIIQLTRRQFTCQLEPKSDAADAYDESFTIECISHIVCRTDKQPVFTLYIDIYLSKGKGMPSSIHL